MDQETGWAYWANTLNAGQATSYLIDRAEMGSAAHDINGAYYYAIHVDSQLINVGTERFTEEPTSGDLYQFLERIRVGADGNASPQFPAPLRDFNFSEMGPNRIFTTEDGQAFRYLENQGAGNHMIIRNVTLHNVSWNAQPTRLDTWFNTEILQDLRDIVQPVSIPERDEVPGVRLQDVFEAFSMFDTNYMSFWTVEDFFTAERIPVAVREDLTAVNRNGEPQAFALSLADVMHLSMTGSFREFSDRANASVGWWHLRTPGGMRATLPFLFIDEPIGTRAWTVFADGSVSSLVFSNEVAMGGGARPALIIHQ